MPTTIKDLASAANVSTNTVSRALNNKGEVKKETRDRILALAREMNYVPNQLARSLLHHRTKTIGVIVSDNSNPFYARQVRGVEDCTRFHGYNMILCNSDENPERESAALAILREKRIDGLLITPASTDGSFAASLPRYQLPMVLLNRATEDADVDYVKTDNVLGARLAVKRLLDRGCRRVCYLSGALRISSLRERLVGARQAMRDAGLSEDVLHVIEIGSHVEDGYLQARSLLQGAVRPDGLFAFNDTIAIGAMRAIREAGLRIPDDVAVVGYDDIEIASYLEISLTTVRQKRYELGWKGAELLISKLADREKHQPQHIEEAPELIIRESA
jgi:LacI family transcriptional regulator